MAMKKYLQYIGEKHHDLRPCERENEGHKESARTTLDIMENAKIFDKFEGK